MRRLLVVALNDLRLIFINRSIWFNLILIPIIVTFGVGTANSRTDSGGAPERVNLDVIDHDKTPLSAELQRQIAANPAIRLCGSVNEAGDDLCELGGVALTPELARQRLDDDLTAALVEIPSEFEAAAAGGSPVEIVYRSNEDVSAPSVGLQSVQTAVTRLNSAMAAVQVGEEIAEGMEYLTFRDDADRSAFLDSIRANAQTIWESEPIRIEETQPGAAANPGAASGFQQSVPGMGSMYVLFAVLPLSAAFLRDTRQGTIQRALAAPVHRAQIMGGKLLAYFTIGMVQLAVIFTFGSVLGVRFGSDPVALIATMAAFTLAVTGLALMLTTFVKSEGQASGVNLLVTLTLAPLGGAWWPLDIVPEWLRAAGHISPIAWAMDAYHALQFYDAGLAGVIAPVAALLGMAALFFAVGVARLKPE